MSSNKRFMATELQASQLYRIETIIIGKNKKRRNADNKKNMQTKLFRS